MTATIALAGDTMLGRLVADELASRHPTDLVHPAVAEVMRGADACLLNLECCISDRGEPWPDPAKPFFFRAPPAAVEVLGHLGVDAVTLANNHALDFGHQALLDTLDHLRDAGIGAVGAGADRPSAREPIEVTAAGLRVRVVAFTDHPADYAAAPDRPGVAHVALDRGLPRWVTDEVERSDADLTLVMPHWGPNMTSTPVTAVRRGAVALVDAGADLVAGHSAHVFHGARVPGDGSGTVLFDLGDFLDDYAVDPARRNDLGLLWLVAVASGRVVAVDALPLHLGFARTEPAVGDDRAWIVERLTSACADEGTRVEDDGERLRLLPG